MAADPQHSSQNVSLGPAAEDAGDLAQVHTNGNVEPLEPLASRRLSAREGIYRVLPSAPGVILMRAVEPDGRGPLRLAGEITAPGSICDIFVMLGQMGWRGQLILSDEGATRTLFFDQGNVLGAQTSVAGERLGAVMYRYGVLSEADLERVAAHAGRGGRFGAVALELGLITQRDVFRCLKHQIEDIAFACFAQSSGTFCFLEGFDSKKLVSHQVISAQALVMDGVTRMDEIRYFREKIPSAAYIPARAGLTTEPKEEYRATYQAIDGLLSIGELGRRTGRGEFAITRDVYGLERSGHVLIRPPERTTDPRALTELCNRLLAAIHAEADAARKGQELRKGLTSFARGGKGYDTLLAKAGPAEDGTFDARRLASNAARALAQTPEGTLRRMLYEYVSFAIFCVGATLGFQKESELSSRLAPELRELEPR
ncbi:MAG TPA: DUF4388 domain-containing protein [Polyangiaceae bacterium]|nr:DUF4388 domain-containing protein [Polyangiaceae bacterium]